MADGKTPGPGIRVALVTGGSGGIGSACCKALAAEGFRVCIHYNRGRQAAEALLDEIGGGGFTVSADMGDTSQIDSMVSTIREKAGRLDVLVNNAGLSVNKLMTSMSIGDFDLQQGPTRGAWYLAKKVVRTFMLRQKSGRIINISSVTAYLGNGGQVAYTMGKAAIDAMTRSLARELGQSGILVNSVAPGFIDTAMTATLPEQVRNSIVSSIPMGRIGKPEEVAQAVAFLASSGTYINGAVIHVNGGMYG